MSDEPTHHIIREEHGESPSPPLFDYDAWGYDEDGLIHHQLYGQWWPSDKRIERLDIELALFRCSHPPEKGGLGKYGHLRECIDLLWNSGQKQYVEWNPWLEKMLEECCENEFLSVAGCSSSGKSFGGAIYAIVNFLSNPAKTLVLVTSTSIGAAKKRIWKSVIELWNSLPTYYKGLGRIKPSVHMIHYQPPDGTTASEASSISLVAAEQKQEASAVAKLVGLKNERVILIADELCELSPAVIAATDNLISNPEFQMIAMSNPKGREDPFGLMCEPVNGWSEIDESMYEWRTKYGKAIRFDVLQSTNYIEQERIYKYMLTYEKIEKARLHHGETSSTFYRFFRGFFPVQGSEDCIYSDTDFNAYVSDRIDWKSPPKKVAGIDMAFTSGGDRTAVCVCLYGENKDGLPCIQFEKIHLVKDDAANKKVTRTDQVIYAIKKILDQEGIPYENVAADNSSGGGITFIDRLVQITSPHVLRVNFGGKASDKPVSANDRTPSHKKYYNRVSELWGVGIEFMRGGQFAGLAKDPELVSEMKARRYEDVKGGDGERMRVESKEKMKPRTGRSPDKADAFFIAVELCRTKFHFRSQERGLAVLPKNDFIRSIKRFDLVTASTGGSGDWVPMAG